MSKYAAILNFFCSLHLEFLNSLLNEAFSTRWYGDEDWDTVQAWNQGAHLNEKAEEGKCPLVTKDMSEWIIRACANNVPAI